MGIKAAIRSALINDATLGALIGTRVSPILSGYNDVMPRVVYARTNVDPVEHLEGVSTLRYDFFNIVSISNTYDECDAISERIKTILDGLINTTVESVFVRRCLLQNSSEDHWTPEGREKPIYETIQSWKVAYHG